MQSFKAAWDERETEISWENTGGKIVSTGKDTMKLPSSSRMDFPSPYVATCLEHPSQYLNPQVSHHFRRGKTGDRYLAQEDMVSWAFGKERRP